MTRLLVLNVDRTTAGHLAVAIELHRRHLERADKPCPPGLIDLQHAAIEAGRGATDDDNKGDTVPELAKTGGDVLTQRKAAEILGLSARTIGRMLDRGELEGVTVGSRRRVLGRGLDRFAVGRGRDGPRS
ncbi:MAG: helix-turn-helix domain-containing protein [Solirubrobacterales bacterium]|nr:helix-turn-helix domain-containing protein [Solirubrobacterales bacterium]